jgi:hypothetical protein
MTYIISEMSEPPLNLAACSLKELGARAEGERIVKGGVMEAITSSVPSSAGRSASSATFPGIL